MGSTRFFWVGTGLVIAADLVLAVLLRLAGRLPGDPWTNLAGIGIDGLVLALLLLAVGILAIGGIAATRTPAPSRSSAAARTAALLQVVADHPPGRVAEGEGTDQWLGRLVDALRTAADADGAAVELLEDGMVVRAAASGTLSPYRGLRTTIAGTPLASAVDAPGAIVWHAPKEPRTTTTGSHPAMVIAPIRSGSRVLGVVRIAQRDERAFQDELPFLETIARYVGAVLWKAPAQAFEEQEAVRRTGELEGGQRLRAALEGLADHEDAAIWIEGAQRDILFANPMFERLYGRGREALHANPETWLDVLEPTERDRVRDALDAHSGVKEATYQVPRRGASPRWIRHRAIPLDGQGGGARAVGHVALDITDLQQASSELAALKRHLWGAIDRGPVVCYGARPGGDYGLIYVTPNVDGVLGHSPGQFTQDPTFWSAHLHPDDQTRVFEGLAKLFEKGQWEHEYRLRHADGEYRILRDNMRLLRSNDGEPVEIVGSWIDVTERKRAEEGVAYSLNRIKELQESRTRLLNNISHDLSSPLTPIKLQLTLLKSRADMPEASKKGLDIIDRNVEHVALLIRDLNDVARLEAGQLKVDPQPMDLADAVRAAVESFQPSAHERGVALDVTAPKTLRLVADAQRVNQVLFNYLTNALKFTPQGGTVHVVVSKTGTQAQVNVTDSGRGLAGEEIDRLFKPFSQVHDRTQMKEKGTGLGLYICKGLIEKHGGRVGVASPGLGKGSTFSFTLPTKPSAPKE